MNKIHFICTLLFCFNIVNGQNSNDIVIGKIDKINSKILNEEREIWVHVPGGTADGLFEAQNCPVVYLLDGDAHFYSVVGMIHQLSAVNGNAICPKMIVVGILNTNRTRDLTPIKGDYEHPFVDSLMVDDSGGGSEFISFIEKELIPYIDANYPTEPYRMLIGHSFGGLTVVNTLIHQPELFNSYIAIDPSMWWGDKELLNQIRDMEFDEKFNRKSLYLGIANTMSKGMDTLTAKKDTTFDTEHIRSILELNSLLNSQEEFSYKGKFYEEDGHSSLPLITEYDALRFIFDFYELKFEEEDFSDPNIDLVDKVEKHYIRLSEEFGSELKPDEELVNNLGYQFMGMEQFDKSERFFKLNVTNYPTSFNVYDSLGDFYSTVGNKEKAIENYKKSISINKDSFSKEKLNELLKD